MPILDGLSTLMAVKDKFRQFNLAQSHYHREVDSQAKQDEVARPMICYLSQFNKNTMNSFITKEEEADCFLEKPILFNDILALLKLLYLCWHYTNVN